MSGTHLGLAACFIIGCSSAVAVPVSLQNATATYSQNFNGSWMIAHAIDGNTGGGNGWSIYEPDADQTNPQTGVFEASSDIGFVGGSLFTFTIRNGGSLHTLGRFRLSVTTDDRSTFADGLQSGGDVSANWLVLDPASYFADFATLTELGDNSILASGSLIDFDVYTITAPTTLVGITGFRIELLTDPSLPTDGPGRQPSNGNIILREFEVDIVAASVPESGQSVLLLALGLAGLAFLRLRSQFFASA